MSELRLVIREADRDWSGVVHEAWADRAIAALSADPVTRVELEAACGRFARRTPNSLFLESLAPGFCVEAHEGGIIVLDLAARMVVVNSSCFQPERAACVLYHDGECQKEHWLPFHLADDWLLLHHDGQWLPAAESRRRDRKAQPVFDAREVFYGRPLLEFIARETRAAFLRTPSSAPRTEEIPEDPDERPMDRSAREAVKQVHADWLLTPRDDLGGACPRDVAFEQHKQMSFDLQDQCQRWSLVGHCPPGLEKSAFAYRFGGFGTHELVKYYYLIRELLGSCWERLEELRMQQQGAGELEMLTTGDFLAGEVPRLERVREEWLDTPDPECHGRTPRSIVERERLRLPEGMSGKEAMVDADCPCCQMLADMHGVMFWHLDGCNMDDEFAFDISHRTREEWDAERRKWEEFNRRFNAEQEERKRRIAAGEIEDERAIWSSSYCAANDTNAPFSIRLFGIGARLSELIGDLRGEDAKADAGPQLQQSIDQLNRDFGNLRDILLSDEQSRADALLQPVLDRFSESLAATAHARPDLAAKCESLTTSLSSLLESPRLESNEEFGDEDVPF